MPATDTGSQLYRAILADPADDTLRLAYADFLDETGDHARAEFVRVQIELARPWVCDGCRRVEPKHPGLYARERELWRAHAMAWFRGGEWGATWRGTDKRLYEKHHGGWTDGPNYIDATFSRGFVSHVTLPAATFVGGECGCVQGCRYGPVVHAIDCKCCPACDGTGRTPGVAAALFARHPIERVAFPGLEPDHDSRERLPYQWHRIVPGDYPTGTPVPRHELPREVWDLMAGDRPRGTVNWKGYSTRDLALSALSDAGVRLGRKRAGLPPIPGCTPRTPDGFPDTGGTLPAQNDPRK